MKIALINDIHYGARQDSIPILDYKKRFFDNIFFPYLDADNIDTICLLGDLVDRRKYINIQTANRMRTDFIEPILKSGKKLHIIPGNHDVYYKNSNAVNVLQEVLDDHPNLFLYMHPTEVEFDATKILMMPWICEENQEECLKSIETTTAPILFGHLELQGFEMHSGHFCQHGQDAKLFDKFDLVASGHFHHKSTYQNINYLGNPLEMSWSDYGDPKGFHIFDTSNRALTYVPNQLKLFHKIYYADEGKSLEEILDVNFKKYAKTYVKVIVKSKSNPFFYDAFITKLEEVGPLDIKSVDDHLNLNIVVDEEILSEAETTLDILTKTVKQSGVSKEYQAPLEILLKELYNKANLIQS